MRLQQAVLALQPWPCSPVADPVLTPHGIEALKLLGAYDRSNYPSLVPVPVARLVLVLVDSMK
jgi:hypothetical protein